MKKKLLQFAFATKYFGAVNKFRKTAKVDLSSCEQKLSKEFEASVRRHMKVDAAARSIAVSLGGDWVGSKQHFEAIGRRQTLRKSQCRINT
jgi:hypothetical protein